MSVQNMPAPHGDASKRCGQCQWFVQGFEGKTCQVLRNVSTDTRACIEFQPFKQSPFSIIEKDKFLIEMRKTMLVWTEESLKDYDRKVRSFKITSKEAQLKDPMAYVDEAKLAELGCVFQTCQAYSEALLELRYNIMDKSEELQTYAKEVQAYLFSQYKEHVGGLKNDSERAAFYRAAAPELFRALDKMEALKKKAELAHENLKSTHFALGRKQDAILELWKAKIASLSSDSRSRTSG